MRPVPVKQSAAGCESATKVAPSITSLRFQTTGSYGSSRTTLAPWSAGSRSNDRATCWGWSVYTINRAGAATGEGRTAAKDPVTATGVPGGTKAFQQPVGSLAVDEGGRPVGLEHAIGVGPPSALRQ